MPTNLNINDALLQQALKTGGFATKKATVDAALTEFIQRREQLHLLNFLGKVEFAPGYNYKKQRRRK